MRFDGLHARRVATLPINSAADLQQDALHRAHRSTATTSGTGTRAAAIYELLAPDGTNYVMQAYSQIVDPPAEQLGDLASLGDRLDAAGGLALSHAKARATRSTLKASGEVDDPPGRAAEHLPAAARAQARSRKPPRRRRHGNDQGHRRRRARRARGQGNDHRQAVRPAARSTLNRRLRPGQHDDRDVQDPQRPRLGLRNGGHHIRDQRPIEITFDGTAELTGGTKAATAASAART